MSDDQAAEEAARIERIRQAVTTIRAECGFPNGHLDIGDLIEHREEKSA